MNLETAKQIWRREAQAHGYVGFLIIAQNSAYERIFIRSKEEAKRLKTLHATLDEVYI